VILHFSDRQTIPLPRHWSYEIHIIQESGSCESILGIEESQECYKRSTTGEKDLGLLLLFSHFSLMISLPHRKWGA
jgi:hypothetical protein